MKLRIRKIGELIKLDEKRNSKNIVNNNLGINIFKNFIPSIANLSETDLSRYKIINYDNFACNIMHVGRDEKLPIALYKSKIPALVSPAYKVFSVKNKEELIPEYLMIFFHRSEFDRLTWYFCDSSVRGGLDWDRFKEIEIPVPEKIQDQQKYVDIYQNLIKNQKSHEESLSHLEFICNSYIEKIKTKKNINCLGNHIKAVSYLNGKLEYKNVRGISSVNKNFMKARANMTGVDIAGYKIVKKDQFAYNPNTARMGDRIPIALNLNENCLVSKIYPVFEVKDKNFLLPEYLYIFFKRKEFDRYARYNSWGSARETFDWNEMCEVKLPIPSIKEQQSIISINKILQKRSQINDELKKKLKIICPLIFKKLTNVLKTYN